MSDRAKVTAKTPEWKTDTSVSQTKKSNFSPSINSPIDQILFLQRTVGNQAVERLLESGVIQARLTIGRPGDIQEQEADRVAEQVMRMPELSRAQSKRVSKDNKVPRIQRVCTECDEELQRQTQNSELGYLEHGYSSEEEPHRKTGGIQVQQMCSECKEAFSDSVGATSSRDRSRQDGARTLSFMESDNRDSKLQRQPNDEEREILQTKEVSGSTPEVGSETESQINSIRGGGQPLSESVRAFFEPRFGEDLSRVRIHTGSNAGESAKAVNALAYTLGQDVVFGGGRYSPETTEGKRLLAHELTHVMQQTRMDTGQSRFILREPLKGMDLTAPFWSGKKEVENILDGIDKVKFGRKDNVVTIIQEALLKLGFTLPKFGADGDFGSETRRAVMDFQRSAGLTGVDVDGEVGSKTITLMDMALREGRTEKDRDDKSRDTKILNLPPDAADNKLGIYFFVGDSHIPSQEFSKIPEIVKALNGKAVVIEGMASEEGPPSLNRSLAEERAFNIKKALQDNGFESDIQVLIDPSKWEGVQAYAEMRKAQVKTAQSLQKDQPCSGDTCSCNQLGIISAGVKEGSDMVDASEQALKLDTDKKKALFDGVFNTDDKTRPQAADKVKKVIEDLKKFLNSIPKPDRHTCFAEDNENCKAGAVAFYQATPDSMGICPVFFDRERNITDIARILIHESHHSVFKKDAHDFAYDFMRIIKHLDTDTAIKNADSVAVYIIMAKHPDKEKLGPNVSDIYSPDFTENEKKSIDHAIALIGLWIEKADALASVLYQAYSEALKEGWKEKDFAFDIGQRIASKFNLTRPPLRPKSSDLLKLAAIYDRIRRMRFCLTNALSIRKSNSDVSNWVVGTACSVDVGNNVLKMDLEHQAAALLQELVHGSPDISATLEPSYFEFVYIARNEVRRLFVNL